LRISSRISVPLINFAVISDLLSFYQNLLLLDSRGWKPILEGRVWIPHLPSLLQRK
jgi:hypothetical protein